MKDAMLNRMWIDRHDRFSADLGRTADRIRARMRGTEGDKLPLIGRAAALVLAVSLASLSVGATLA